MHACVLPSGMYEVQSVVDKQSKPSWADHLSPVRLHYYNAGVVENAEDLIERHKVATQCSLEREAPPRKLTLVPLVAKKLIMKQLHPRYILVSVQSWCPIMMQKILYHHL